MKKKPEKVFRKIIAQNKKARHNYHIDDKIEAGIILIGSEVKSLRAGNVSIEEAWAGFKDDKLYLFNMYIQEYKQASYQNHESKRPRQLLMHKKEISKLRQKIQAKGITVVPLLLYFNVKGIAKVEIGLGKGKKMHDKRESDKTRDWDRQKQRIMREYNK